MSYVLRTMFPVRRDRTPDETDIVALKQSLERLGQYESPNWQKATDYDEGLFQGIEAFQRDRGLKVDGVVNPKGPTAEAIGAELGPRSPLVMEKDPRPVQGVRDPRSFPLRVSADARGSNQRSVKAIQNTGKFGLLPGLAATAWQKGDAGKAEVVDLFHQLHNADEAGARNLEARFLPMIPRDDRGLFRQLRARKEGKADGTTQVAENSTERAFREAGETIGKALGLRELTKTQRLERERKKLIGKLDDVNDDIDDLLGGTDQSIFKKLGKALGELSKSRDDHLDFYEDYEMNRVPPVPRREGSPPEMEVPETKLDPKISKRVTKSDVANKLKERDKIQKRIDQITTELERLHPGRRR